MAPHADNTYSHMTAALGLRSWFVNEISSYYYAHYGVLEPERIELAVDTVAKAYAEVNGAPAHDDL